MTTTLEEEIQATKTLFEKMDEAANSRKNNEYTSSLTDEEIQKIIDEA